jgi:hypothetical protein
MRRDWRELVGIDVQGEISKNCTHVLRESGLWMGGGGEREEVYVGVGKG